MSKIITLAVPQPPVDSQQVARARAALEQAYAYYGTTDEISAPVAIEAVEAPIEQMFTYYPAA